MHPTNRTSRTRRATVVVAVVILLMLVALWAFYPRAGAPASVTLSIVGTNDLHGGVTAREGRGGLALLAGYLRNLREARARDGAVVLVDAGDLFQGTLESNAVEGASVIQAYNAIGYQAAAIGNHDFDFGPVGPSATPRAATDDPRGALKARAAEASFPFLAANLLDTATGRPVQWPHVSPSTVIDAAGIKVGVVGVITREALTTTIAANTRGLAIAPLAETIDLEAGRLRAAGATVVIALAHAGGRCTTFDQPADLSSCDGSAEIVDVARALRPGLVDAIIGGHTHAGMAHEVAGIPVTQAFSGGRAFDRIDLTVDRKTRRVTGHRIFAPHDLCEREDPVSHACGPLPDDESSARRVPARYEGQVVTASADIAGILEPAIQRVRALKATSLGVLIETPLRRGQSSESALGNLFTDAFRASVKGADVAINNTDGGLRADLPAGPLTYGSLYEVFPFDNRIVKLTLTGRQSRAVIATQLQSSRAALGISGLQVDARCTGRGLDVVLRGSSGRTIRDAQTLVVATTDFLATGGDGIFAPVMPAEGFALADDTPLARDVVAEWLRRRGGRLQEAQLVDPSHRRWMHTGALPMDCRAPGGP